MIPKKIFTAWFSEAGTIPETIQSYIDSQKIEGYEHHLITLDNVVKDHPYILQCLSSKHGNKKWVKLTDFVRMWYLYHEGGIFLDADVQVVTNFDNICDKKVVLGLEGQGTIPNSIVIGSAIVAAEKHNPFILKWLDTVIANFRGDDDLCYESSMDILNLLALDNMDKITLLPPEYFYPYHHSTDTLNVTENTICIHWFNKTWITPKVTILIPQLGREEGLQKCLDSIHKLNYPMDKIEIIILVGKDTVPIKIARGYAKATGEYICYAANDMTFHPDCLKNAIHCSRVNNKSLVSFNEGPLYPDNGNICTHFIIHRKLVEHIGEIFDTEMNHIGVDNILWAKASALNEAIWCKDAIIDHRHFSKGFPMDEVYVKGWNNLTNERDKLATKLNQICST